MMTSPIMKWAKIISFWIVTIVAINLGLLPILQYNPLEKVLGMIGLGGLFMPIHYIVGIAGIICLLSLVMWKHCHCDE